mgnify:CR=1 FL=1
MANDEFYAFADISVLVDYCRPHTESGEYSQQVLNYINSEGGELSISKNCSDPLEKRITNRQRLFKHLMDRASEYLKRDISNPEQEFRNNELSFTELKQNAPLGVRASYKDEVGKLEQLLDDVGLAEFRTQLYDLIDECSRAFSRLDQNIIHRRYSRGGKSNWMIESMLHQHTNDDAQVDSMMDAHYWCQNMSHNTILISHHSTLYNARQKMIDADFGGSYSVELFSPKDAILNPEKVSQ